MSTIEVIREESFSLLYDLIRNPTFSREEEKSAYLVNKSLTNYGITTHSKFNNIWAFNKHFNPELPTILLNSHHDTVKPNSGYTRSPFTPTIEGDKLYGLGSNDAGGSLVSLIAVFKHFYFRDNLKYNLIFVASAEEEVSGRQGIEDVLPLLPEVAFAIVGEPTEMHPAIAEKGLLVIDAVAHGESGHAARHEGKNALYLAAEDLVWIKNHPFPKASEWLGPVKMTVSNIHAGEQHNTVPGTCQYVIDIRLNELYTHQDILDALRDNLHAALHPRSVRLKPSFIDPGHPVVKAAEKYGGKPFGSPTMSDQALMTFPSLKMGPGKSERSHMADEYIHISEINEGIERYINILEEVNSSVGGEL